MLPIPFGVGERLEYSISGKIAHLPAPLSGTGTMEVFPMDSVRGHSAFHIRFTVHGGVPIFFTVNDKYESWLDAKSLESLRYVQSIREDRYARDRHYEIFPDLRQFKEDSNPPQPSVEHPLDDGSFLYFIRTIPLAVGETKSFPYYFKADRNPVTIEVLRKDRIHVADKDWDAIVVRPIIATSDKGLFTKDSDAEIWLSDDNDHIILQLRSHFILGSSLNLALKSYHPATPK